MGYEEIVRSILKQNKPLEIKWQYYNQILAHCIATSDQTAISEFLLMTISISIILLNNTEYFHFIKLLFAHLKGNQAIQDINFTSR